MPVPLPQLVVDAIAEQKVFIDAKESTAECKKLAVHPDSVVHNYTKNVGANSYEWGIYPKAGEFYFKHKIYYETEAERLAKIEAINESEPKEFKPEHAPHD